MRGGERPGVRACRAPSRAHCRLFLCCHFQIWGASTRCEHVGRSRPTPPPASMATADAPPNVAIADDGYDRMVAKLKREHAPNALPSFRANPNPSFYVSGPGTASVAAHLRADGLGGCVVVK